MATTVDVNQLALEGDGGLVDVLKQLPDPRKHRGVRHPYHSVLAVAVCAVLSGARSFAAIGEHAQDLAWEVLARLGFRRRKWGPPSEPTIRRVLQATDPAELDQRLGHWVAAQGVCEVSAVALDGKTVRGSGDETHKPFHLFSALMHEAALVLGQVCVNEKSNEITAVKPLLDEMEIDGATVTADALHTQKEFARYLVEDKHADYVLIAKENQPTLLHQIQALDWGSFSPAAYDAEQRPWSNRDPHHLGDG